MHPPDPPARREIRYPLQVGTRALARRTWGAVVLIPALVLVLGAGALLLEFQGAWWMRLATMVAVGWLASFPFYFLRHSIRNVWLAWHARPSDLVLGPDGFRVDGGPSHGLVVQWREIQPDAVSLEDVCEPPLTRREILSLHLGRALRANVPIARLRIGRVKGDVVYLGCADTCIEDHERASLAALLETIQFLARGGSTSGEPTAEASGEAREPEDSSAPRSPAAGVLICTKCGAPVVPREADFTQCDHCGESVGIPAELRQRLHAATALPTERVRAERTVAKLLRQPSAPLTNWLLAGGGALGAAAWAFATWIRIPQCHDSVGLAAITGIGIAWPVVGAMYLLERWILVDRSALGSILLDCGARAPRLGGGPLQCHHCGAALREQPDAVVVPCVYCLADNVTAMDPQLAFRKLHTQGITLQETLRRRQRGRRGWMAVAVFAIPLAYAAMREAREPLQDRLSGQTAQMVDARRAAQRAAAEREASEAAEREANERMHAALRAHQINPMDDRIFLKLDTATAGQVTAALSEWPPETPPSLRGRMAGWARKACGDDPREFASRLEFARARYEELCRMYKADLGRTTRPDEIPSAARQAAVKALDSEEGVAGLTATLEADLQIIAGSPRSGLLPRGTTRKGALAALRAMPGFSYESGTFEAWQARKHQYELPAAEQDLNHPVRAFAASLRETIRIGKVTSDELADFVIHTPHPDLTRELHFQRRAGRDHTLEAIVHIRRNNTVVVWSYGRASANTDLAHE